MQMHKVSPVLLEKPNQLLGATTKRDRDVYLSVESSGAHREAMRIFQESRGGKGTEGRYLPINLMRDAPMQRKFEEFVKHLLKVCPTRDLFDVTAKRTGGPPMDIPLFGPGNDILNAPKHHFSGFFKKADGDFSVRLYSYQKGKRMEYVLDFKRSGTPL